MTRLLIVDDEPHLLHALTVNLTGRGYDVATATSASRALAEIHHTPPDLLVLDLGLPDLDGLEVIRELRENGPDLPILVLSARHTSADMVAALDLGALDYVVKPFNMDELIARLRAVIRRTTTDTNAATVVTIGEVSIDLAARTARHHGAGDDTADSSIHFTPTEWRLLDVLLRKPGRLITARELLLAVGNDPDRTERSYLRIYLAQLRRKLEPTPSHPRHLITEPGMGYRFIP
ncbi:response regulator [Jatrophihabitans sp.]|uniref:response regulator n=1 Tax=Jatrophihabitans sp. TaxID=1932789 RepID=UPI0030C6AE7B|nr:two component transcriptional regulator, winged helix family [Jatrophihabitans sp.]